MQAPRKMSPLGQRCKSIVDHDRASLELERADRELTEAVNAPGPNLLTLTAQRVIAALTGMDLARANLERYTNHGRG